MGVYRLGSPDGEIVFIGSVAGGSTRSSASAGELARPARSEQERRADVPDRSAARISPEQPGAVDGVCVRATSDSVPIDDSEHLEDPRAPRAPVAGAPTWISTSDSNELMVDDVHDSYGTRSCRVEADLDPDEQRDEGAARRLQTAPSRRSRTSGLLPGASRRARRCPQIEAPLRLSAADVRRGCRRRPGTGLYAPCLQHVRQGRARRSCSRPGRRCRSAQVPVSPTRAEEARALWACWTGGGPRAGKRPRQRPSRPRLTATATAGS